MASNIPVATIGSQSAADAVDRAIALAQANDGASTAASVVDTLAHGCTDMRAELACETCGRRDIIPVSVGSVTERTVRTGPGSVPIVRGIE